MHHDDCAVPDGAGVEVAVVTVGLPQSIFWKHDGHCIPVAAVLEHCSVLEPEAIRDLRRVELVERIDADNGDFEENPVVPFPKATCDVGGEWKRHV